MGELVCIKAVECYVVLTLEHILSSLTLVLSMNPTCTAHAPPLDGQQAGLLACHA